jgi:hypothetical protein
MSKGYPSVERTRKAYWRGAADARRERARNPYRNERLADLWTRGREHALANPALKIPTKFGQRHADKERPRPSSNRPGSNRPGPNRPGPNRPTRRDPRDWDRGGGRGGW